MHFAVAKGYRGANGYPMWCDIIKYRLLKLGSCMILQQELAKAPFQKRDLLRSQKNSAESWGSVGTVYQSDGLESLDHWFRWSNGWYRNGNGMNLIMLYHFDLSSQMAFGLKNPTSRGQIHLIAPSQNSTWVCVAQQKSSYLQWDKELPFVHLTWHDRNSFGFMQI